MQAILHRSNDRYDVELRELFFANMLCFSHFSRSRMVSTTGTVTDEPLATMADFRALDSKNSLNRYFAQNAIVAPGYEGRTISLGAPVEVLQWGDPVYAD